MSDNELIKNAMDSINGIKKFTLIDTDGSTITKTIDEILDYINDPESHSADFIPYDHNDWIEGLCNFGAGHCVVFDAGQKFYWNDPDNGACSKFVTLTEQTKVDLVDEIMCCESEGIWGDYPLNELTPIIDTENRPYKQIGNRWIYINVDDEGSYSYFTTDLDGYELDSFATIKECEEAIEKENSK